MGAGVGSRARAGIANGSYNGSCSPTPSNSSQNNKDYDPGPTANPGGPTILSHSGPYYGNGIRYKAQIYFEKDHGIPTFFGTVRGTPEGCSTYWNSYTPPYRICVRLAPPAAAIIIIAFVPCFTRISNINNTNSPPIMKSMISM